MLDREGVDVLGQEMSKVRQSAVSRNDEHLYEVSKLDILNERAACKFQVKFLTRSWQIKI